MTREEKIKTAIKEGFIYNPESGKIYGPNGKEIVRKHTKGYIFMNIYNGGDNKSLLGHQFAYYYVHGEVVDCIDHINGIKSDNRISNLRKVTNQQNSFNKPNSRGYYYEKSSGKYKSQIGITVDNTKKRIFLGRYDTEQEANNAYLEAKKIYHII